VERFRRLAGDAPSGPIRTVTIETAGWMRRPALPPIPLEIRMAHRLGHDFMHDIRIGRGRVSVRLGLDAYVDGHGLMQVGPSLHAGVTFDQGALIALWCEALGFPDAWASREDMRWEPLDEDAARLVVAGPTGEIPIDVDFDPATGCPTACTAERYKGAGPMIRWVARLEGWTRFHHGALAPARFSAHWTDEPRPWLELRTSSVTVNAPVDDALQRGRAALRRARASAGTGRSLRTS
jgi:hypothetical protein